jgi:hypothetical protein
MMDSASDAARAADNAADASRGINFGKAAAGTRNTAYGTAEGANAGGIGAMAADAHNHIANGADMAHQIGGVGDVADNFANVHALKELPLPLKQIKSYHPVLADWGRQRRLHQLAKELEQPDRIHGPYYDRVLPSETYLSRMQRQRPPRSPRSMLADYEY